MFLGCLQDFSRMFSGCSDGSYWPGGIWWSFQMKVWTLKIQRNPMIPKYLMIPAAAIRWSPGIWWFSTIRWSQQLLFDDPQVFVDPQLFDDQLEVWTLIVVKSTVIPPSMMVLFSNLSEQMFLGGIVCSALNELWKFPLELQALKLWCAWSVIVGNFHYLYFWNVLILPLDFARKPCFRSLWKGNTRCQIWCTIELHRDPISKVLSEW